MKSRKVLFSLVLALVLCMMAGVAMAKTAQVGSYSEMVNALADATVDNIVLTNSFTIEDSDTSSFNAFNITRAITIDGTAAQYSIIDKNATKSGSNDVRLFTIQGPTGSETANITFLNLKLTIDDGTATPTCGRIIQIAENVNINLKIDNCLFKTAGVGGGSNPHNQALNIVGNKANKMSVTISNSTIDSNISGEGYAIVVWDPVDMEITNSTLSGYAALYLKKSEPTHNSAGSEIIINDSELIATNEFSGSTQNFAAIVIETSDIDIEISNTIIQNDKLSTCNQGAFYLSGSAAKNNTITISGDGTITDSILYGGNESNNSVSIQSGTFLKDDPSKLVSGSAPVATVSENGKTVYAVGNASIENAVSSSSATVIITKGSADLNLPIGTQITNKTTNTIIVNGNVVPANSTVSAAAVELKNRTPRTGDNANIALWVILMAISAVSFVALGRKSRFN